MSKPVFISYSTDDTALTEQIRDSLEAVGIAGWMAPRDIVPGQDYAEQIIAAIEDCTVLLLVLSDSANDSQYVRNEVERAVAKRKVIIPMRIQEVEPSRSLEFFVSNAQWIDGTGDMQQATASLIEAVANYLPSDIPPAAVESPEMEQSQAVSDVAPPNVTEPKFLQSDPPARNVDHPLVVAREQEFARLNDFLDDSLSGNGQVI